MTVTRLIIYALIALAIMFGFLYTVQYSTEQNIIQGGINSQATATAEAIALSEKNEDFDTKIAIAEAISYRALELDATQRILHAIVAAHIVKSIDADNKFERSVYTRRALLQVLSDQTVNRSEPSPIRLENEPLIAKEIVSNDENWMLTFHDTNVPILLDLHNVDPNSRLLKIDVSDNKIDYARFSPHDKWLVLISADETPLLVKLDEVSDGYSAIPLHQHTLGFLDYAFSQNDKWFATGSQDSKVRLWNLEKLNRESPQDAKIELFKHDDAEYPGHTRSVTAIGFDPKSHWLGSGGLNGEIFLWNLDTDDPGLNPIRLAIANDLFVSDLRFTHNDDTDLLIAIGRDKSVDYTYIWNMKIEHLMGLACDKHKPTQEQVDEIYPESFPFKVPVCSLG